MNDDGSILTDDDIQKIYDLLSDEDKTVIGYIAMQLEDNFKKKWNDGNHITNANFGPKQSLELICKLSIFLFERYGPDPQVWNLFDACKENQIHELETERI